MISYLLNWVTDSRTVRSVVAAIICPDFPSEDN